MKATILILVFHKKGIRVLSEGQISEEYPNSYNLNELKNHFGKAVGKIEVA